MTKTNWKELVGKRCLVTNHPYFSVPEVYEVEILEVSPSGRVKIKYVSGTTEWRIPEVGGKLTLVEVLE